jgi:hypothetical protein
LEDEEDVAPLEEEVIQQNIKEDYWVKFD